MHGDEVELARNEERLRRAILILWRTNMLRQTRLKVIDEVANGLSYYDYTFFREMPRLYGAIEDELAPLDGKRRDRPIAVVPARRLVDRRRPRRQPVRHRRRAERGDAPAERARARPLSRRIARTRRRIVARRQSGPVSAGTGRARRPLDRFLAHPARRALSARHRRHLFAPRQDRARTRSCRRAAPAARRRRRLTRTSRSSPPISTIIAQLARERTAARSSRAGGCGRCRRAVDVFGFHLAPLDLRQNSDVHERTVAELFAAADAGSRLSGARRRGARRAAAPRIALAAPAGLALHRLQRGDDGRARGVPRRRRDPQDLWLRRDPHRDHLEDAMASRTCWSSRCCSRRSASSAPTGRPRSISCRCSRRSTTCAPASA